MRLGELLKRLIQVDPDDESGAIPQNITSEETGIALIGLSNEDANPNQAE
ncbi:MAG: hypothetical protein O2921_01115 [Chloroflexi bacterium]|nr:hypothetical protein [Chloroflexota bacterium]MDA1281219.1 hypothetical protein [Chloroflexota bacterium]